MTENISGIAFAELAQKYSNLEQNIEYMHQNNDAFFLCTNAVIIFFMQCGFAFLEAGAVRSKNTTNILIKNLLDSCIVIVAFWATGYAFAYGGDGSSPWDHLIATAATIVSGAVAERCEFITYIVYCSSISAFVYPVLAHWGWSPYGWFNNTIKFNGTYLTYQDFAGSGLIHLCGGSISFVAAKIVGPRIGRFPKDNNQPHPELQGHSLPFAALGGFILMFGFLAFNGGSAGEISKPGTGNMVALAMTNTILCGALAALTYLLIHYAANGKWSCLLTINAALTGMVAVCAGCNIMQPWACLLTGPGAGIIYLWLSKLVVRLKVDDPLDAFAVHAGGGAWGLLAARIIGHDGIAYAIVGAIDGTEHSGNAVATAFVAFGWQCVCAVAIALWSVIIMVPVFLLLKKLGKLRVLPEIEIKGLDIYKHGEAAYPIHAYGHGWNEVDVKNMKQEISMEELADAYERKTSVLPKVDTRKLSFYHNRDRFEHPEKHFEAMNHDTPKSSTPSSPGADYGTLCARGPILGIAVNNRNGTLKSNKIHESNSEFVYKSTR